MYFFSIFKEKEPDTGKQDQQQPNSTFDRLPIEIIHIILNKVEDAKTLIRCLTLNKRFASIIPQTDTVSLSLALPSQHNRNNNNKDNNNSNSNNNTDGNSVNIVKSTVNYLITKLLRRNGDTVTDSLCHRLRAFRSIKHLHLELHTDPVEVMDEFLKWKAIYGSEFKSCSMVCALSCRPLSDDDDRDEPPRCYYRKMRPPPVYLVNYELRWRKQFLAKCMNAASARHRFVKQILPRFPALETVVISDPRRQGRFYMAKDEIRDLRESMKLEGAAAELSPSPSEEREDPKFLMRMWYATEMELEATGCAWSEAMRLEIVPVDRDDETVAAPPTENCGGGFDCNAEEKARLAEAAREIVNPSKTVSYSWVL